MTDKNMISEGSDSVRSHLEIVQSVIQRMSGNSVSCKAWCITLVSAIFVIVAEKEKPQYLLIAVIPTFLFLILDAYYLALEVRFRNSYNVFIEKLHTNKITIPDLYAVSPQGNQFKAFFRALFSFSVWPFYLTLFILTWVIKTMIN